MDIDTETARLWIRYGIYADRKVRDAEQDDGTFEIPLTFEAWYVEDQRLAGEQDELF